MTTSKQEEPRSQGRRRGSHLRAADLVELDDQELMRAHIEGDPNAFSELVRRHEHWLWRLAWSRLRAHHEAKDAVQEALIRGFRFAHTWRGDGPVHSWLGRIVANVTHERMVAIMKRSQVETSLDEVKLETLGTGDNAAEAIAATVVQDVVASLPEDQAECFVRVHLLGFRYSEVAEELGLAEGTVKSRAARGKAWLVVALREAGLVGDALGRRRYVDRNSRLTHLPPPDVCGGENGARGVERSEE